jgi:hypothetical protein
MLSRRGGKEHQRKMTQRFKVDIFHSFGATKFHISLKIKMDIYNFLCGKVRER